MKVLVIGNGGREHALAWKLAQSPLVQHVYVAPGNAGTHREPNVENVAIAAMDFPALIQFAKKNTIDFTVVGPEAPLVAGIVDAFLSNGLLCLGPTSRAAQLEGSKTFAKNFMLEHGIPTARAGVFHEPLLAIAYLDQCDYPIVIKADGLAAGKGVVIATDRITAEISIRDMLIDQRFGDASRQIIIEDFIVGEEVSFMVISDGEHALPFATSQDHKRRDDGDRGPNTGGMGAYSPAPIVTAALHQKILDCVITPTLAGMAQQGCPFRGFLYAGLMITPTQDIKVLEYNCRLGDPETQPILMRLQSDFASLCLAALHGQLANATAQWDPRPALGVVLAANGYPDQVSIGDPIPTLNTFSVFDCDKIFHAGTAVQDGKIVTQGGRVLCVTALGDNYQEAQTSAYRTVEKIQWNNAFFRHDIGHRAIRYEQERT